MDALPIAAAGLGIGVSFGLFGAGGSAFATPVLATLGVPAPLAIASPLPALLPAAIAGARRYVAANQFDGALAALVVVGGFPGVIAGSLASHFVGGAALLLISGLLLLGLGARLVLPDSAGAVPARARRRDRRGFVVAAAFVVGTTAGLLANGGGFLLVPLFVLALGLPSAEAAGTSLIAAAALTVPTLASHWLLGDIDWVVAGVFAIGVIPGATFGARLSMRVRADALRPVFGGVLIGFALWFLVTR